MSHAVQWHCTCKDCRAGRHDACALRLHKHDSSRIIQLHLPRSCRLVPHDVPRHLRACIRFHIQSVYNTELTSCSSVTLAAAVRAKMALTSTSAAACGAASCHRNKPWCVVQDHLINRCCSNRSKISSISDQTVRSSDLSANAALIAGQCWSDNCAEILLCCSTLFVGVQSLHPSASKRAVDTALDDALGRARNMPPPFMAPGRMARVLGDVTAT